MVNGVAQLRARFNRVPDLVKEEIMAAMEKSADELVREMNSIAPIPEIVVAWTWGDRPAGSLKIGQFRSKDYGRISLTVYATAVTGEYADFPAVALWFEVGTAPRYQKTTGRFAGQIQAQPYFYPTFRSNRSRVRGRLSRAVTKGVKRANS